MTQYLVPFDGTPISKAALSRASAYSSQTGADVAIVTVIPRNNADYARERGWLEADEQFDLETVVGRLRNEANRLCPTGEFEYETVSRYAQSGTVASHLRSVAGDIGADVVFLGSGNAGSIVSNLSSVGQALSVRSDFDIFLVRSTDRERGI